MNETLRNQRLDRAWGALLGGAVGDAMGMPASFFTRRQIKEQYGFIADFLAPAEAQQAHAGLEAASVTDDSMEALLVAQVLLRSGGFDRAAFLDAMKRWALEARMLESSVIGPSTRRFLEAVTQDRDPSEGAREAVTNGSAMRAAPIGLRFWRNQAECAQQAAESSLPSHASAPCVAGACAVACAVAGSIEGGHSAADILALAAEGARYGETVGHDIPAPSVSRRIEWAREIVDRYAPEGTERVLDELTALLGAGMQVWQSVPFALGVFYAAHGDPSAAILLAVNAGDDADTNASIAGAVAGAYRGALALPFEWLGRFPSPAQGGTDYLALAAKLIAVDKD